jgi:NADH:ubiquinone oxidoreductase subunit F (NADH-binding)/(2Fe-2S) ferredoxin/Pyruvate/2-oxoacid:ferredoxin oxidoreductase delta subunit
VKRIRSTEAFEKRAKALAARRSAAAKSVTVCSGTGCSASGAREVIARFKEETDGGRAAGPVEVKATGCHGFCERGPLVVVNPGKIFYQRVTPEDVPEIVRETLANGRVVERLLYRDPAVGKRVTSETEVPFYSKQQRVLMENNGVIDPTDIEDYIAHGGYAALSKVLAAMSGDRVIDEIDRSGLRGRGGAGFATGKKWRSAYKQASLPKYVICNADEGDPGAFQDRSLCEGNPNLIIEGMIIGAYAIGASKGYIYVRAEYPLACEHLAIAIGRAREYGLLGEDILGSGFSFDIEIKKGAGAFVCGEGSALMASIEGRPGEPRPKQIHSTERGLWGRPTVTNNVKTWASVPYIINRGAGWFAGIGTAGSKGTMIFSLVGKVNNTGLVEIPMGTTLRYLVEEIGGGVPGGRSLKAVQTGGPSGGCIPARFVDTPVDYEELTKLGSMMGSGGCVVMDDRTCMVDVARYFLEFTVAESCGKCTPCREGNERMLDILAGICRGRGKEGDLELLEELAEAVADGSLCQLGKTAPNPVLTTLKYFRDEYEAHIRDKKCPAGVCKALISFTIDENQCTGCQACLRACPVGAISGEKKEVHVIDVEKCTRCGSCYEVCKFAAVTVE